MTTQPASLNALLAALNAGRYNDAELSRLPTFGGVEPEDTSGVFSWDEDCILKANARGEFVIVPRRERPASTQEGAFMERFKAHRAAFIASGDRISFGRMEGMKDAAEMLGRPDLVNAIEDAIKERREKIAAMCE